MFRDQLSDLQDRRNAIRKLNKDLMREQLNCSINRHSEQVEKMMLESQREHRKNVKTIEDLRKSFQQQKREKAQQSKQLKENIMTSSRASMERAISRGNVDRSQQ